MHRARTAFNLIAPLGQQNFGSWLVRTQKSKVSQQLSTKPHKLIRKLLRNENSPKLTHLEVGAMTQHPEALLGTLPIKVISICYLCFRSWTIWSPRQESKLTTRQPLSLSLMAPARLTSRKCTMHGFVIQHRCTRWVLYYWFRWLLDRQGRNEILIAISSISFFRFSHGPLISVATHIQPLRRWLHLREIMFPHLNTWAHPFKASAEDKLLQEVALTINSLTIIWLCKLLSEVTR